MQLVGHLYTLSFLSYRNVKDQVSYPYKTTGKIIVLYILILYTTKNHDFTLTLPPSIFTERNDQYGNQPNSRELLMMGIVVPEKCWPYKKYNKIISGI